MEMTYVYVSTVCLHCISMLMFLDKGSNCIGQNKLVIFYPAIFKIMNPIISCLM